MSYVLVLCFCLGGCASINCMDAPFPMFDHSIGCRS